MASNGFAHKWIQSSRGLPGSFMNENHHTMAHVWKGDEQRQNDTATENQTSTTSIYMDREQKYDHQNQQSNDMGDLLGQEPQRSILGPHNDHFQSQQTDFPNDSDFYSRPKKNQDFPVFDDKTNGLREELGDDPDPATKAAYQSATKPIMTSNKSSEAPSVATSIDSNRAIKNQPLVSDVVDEDDYDDDADYYTTSELMPATYAEDDNDQKIETPTSTPRDQVLGNDDVHNQGMVPNNTKSLADAATKTEKTAPLQASDMYHQQEGQNISAGPNSTQQQDLSSSSLRGDNTIQNSLGGIGGKYKNQDLATRQSDKPLAQQGNNGGGYAAKINNAQVNLQQPTEIKTHYNTNIPNDQVSNQRSNANTLSLPNDVNRSSKADGRRRSSLTQSIGKLFGRHHKSS